jgi:hypothetical protein
VGRFACDWHRLPGECPPGNHRPRREPAVSIASEERRRDGPGRREQGDVACARRSKGRRARPRGGTRGEDVVHQDHPGWARPDRTERAGHRCASLRAAPSGLRREVDRPLEERNSGTHVTTSMSAAGGHTDTIAPPSAAATGRHPANFNRCTAWRAGPSNRNGALARSMSGGGHSGHRGRAPAQGTPQRSHHGGASAISWPPHPAQNGQRPLPHPAQRLGNRTSRTRPSTDGT